MDDLPDDLLIEIFLFLPTPELLNIRKVSRRWYGLSYSSDLWKSVDLTKSTSIIQPTMLLNLKKVQDHVKVLTVAPDLLLKIFSEHLWQFVNLKQLTLTSLHGLSAISLFSEPHLRYPCLEKVSFASKQDTDMILTAFNDLHLDMFDWKYAGPYEEFREAIQKLKEMKKFRKVKIKVKTLDNDLLHFLFQNCKALTSLKMSLYNTQITDKGFLLLPDKCCLTELRIACTSISDVSLCRISETCPNLRQIDISRCCWITDNGICSLASRCLKLVEINVFGITNLTNRSLYALAVNCSKLKILNIGLCRSMNHEGISYILERCTKLCNLNLSSNVTNSTMLPSFKVQYNIKSMSLKDLVLSGTNITTEVVLCTLDACPFLQTIVCESCLSIGGSLNNLTNLESKNSFMRCYKWPHNHHSHLKTISLNFSSNIDDNTLIQICKQCPDLRNICIENCPKLTTKVLNSVLTCCIFIDSLVIQKTAYSRFNVDLKGD